MSRDDWLHSHRRYTGDDKPENRMFKADLQEFAHRVGIITSLETGGKIPPTEAFDQMATLWDKLKRSKDSLGIGAE